MLAAKETSPMQKEISDICDRIITEKGWRGFRDSVIEAEDTPHPLSAYITHKERRIHIKVSSHIKGMIESMARNEGLDIDTDTALDSILYHLLVHEYNHHLYCPCSDTQHEAIMNAMYSVVSRKILMPKKAEMITANIANLFSDTVIDTIACHEENSQERARYKIGQDLAMLLVLQGKKKSLTSLYAPKTDKAMQLFAESELYLCNTDPGLYAKMKGYFPTWKGYEDTLKGIIEVFMQDEALVQRIMARELMEGDSKEIRNIMMIYETWGEKAESYARIIFPYMAKDHDWMKNSFTGKDKDFPGVSPGPDQNQDPQEKGQGQKEGQDQGEGEGQGEGQGTPGMTQDGQDEGSPDGQDNKKKDEKDKGKGDDQEKDDDKNKDKKGGQDKKKQGQHGQQDPIEIEVDISDIFNAQDEERYKDTTDDKEKERKEKTPYDRLPKINRPYKPSSSKDKTDPKDSEPGSCLPLLDGKDKRGIGIGNPFRILKYKLGSLRALDDIYMQLGEKINFKISNPDAITEYEIKRGEQVPDFIDLSTIDFGKTIVLDDYEGNTDLIFKEKVMPIDLNLPVPEQFGGIPDLCFVYDSSGSMGFSPGRSGKYHTALLTFYSIINGLEEEGVAPLLKYNGVNFSDRTFASGWHSYKDLWEVKKTLLQYQGGGTTLDAKVLRDIREQRSDSYLLVLLTDFGIYNASDVEEELVKTVEDDAAVVVVACLDGRNINTERLSYKGVNVIYPKDIQDFMNFTIDLTRGIYVKDE